MTGCCPSSHGVPWADAPVRDERPVVVAIAILDALNVDVAMAMLVVSIVAHTTSTITITARLHRRVCGNMARRVAHAVLHVVVALNAR